MARHRHLYPNPLGLPRHAPLGAWLLVAFTPLFLSPPFQSARANDEGANRAAVHEANHAVEEIDLTLTPPRPTCNLPGSQSAPPTALPVPVTPSERFIFAARRIMAIQYQSCEAPLLSPISPLHETLGRTEVPNPSNDSLVVRSITDPLEYELTHPIVSRLNPEPAIGCVDISLAPPMYLYGAKPRISPGRPPNADLFVDQSRASGCITSSGSGTNGAACATPSTYPVTGMDCSGYLSLIFMSSGLRVQRDITPGLLSTSQLVAAVKQSTSCLSPLNLGAAATTTALLQPGDIYVSSGQHEIMVDTTGTDPFGLDRLPPDSPCEALTPADWDFQLIHSSSRGGAAGISRMEAREFFLEAVDFAGPLILMAQDACRIRRGLTPQMNPSPNIKQNSASIPAQIRNTLFIRHQGVKSPGCETPTDQRTRIDHEECVAGCNLLPERSAR